MGSSIEKIFKAIEYYDNDFPENFIKELIDKEYESKKFLFD
ncbi:hypothetical protein SAMN04487886_101926 [Clostridium sp. DSM 8431]|nr:hypothetical protein [Clostridium sp. DSM 8431]SFU40163.1 hypothetical protein SAMN04487886_101926 [Clostridium sp. DSM 8431]